MTPTEIIRMTATICGTTPEMIRSKSRKNGTAKTATEKAVFARWCVWFIMYHYLGLPKNGISSAFDMHHASIIHALGTKFDKGQLLRDAEMIKERGILLARVIEGYYYHQAIAS